MLDRIMALTAFALFLAFFAILVFSVKRLDLAAVVLAGISFAAYDMWRQVGPKR